MSAIQGGMSRANSRNSRSTINMAFFVKAGHSRKQETEYEEQLTKEEYMDSRIVSIDRNMNLGTVKNKYSIKQTNDLREDRENDASLSIEYERKSLKRKSLSLVQTDSQQKCRESVERALEFLSKWEETEDIKMQIQYAAVIISKMENLKKMEIIRSDETKKKICTLLRNAIRLNVSEMMFSKEQVQLLKKGISLVMSDQIRKEDMLELNRKLRKAGLQTMPAWE